MTHGRHHETLVQVQTILGVFSILETNPLIGHIKDRVVILKEIEPQSDEILVSLVGHDLQGAGSTLVADVGGWWDGVGHSIDLELDVRHLGVCRVLEAWERLEAKVVGYCVCHVCLVLDELDQFVELFGGHEEQ